MTTPAAPVKKGPGRPKKAAPVAPISVHGIVTSPATPGDVLELVYCQPRMFKKLFALYKAFGVNRLEMAFDADGLKITTQDHTKKSTIYVFIPGRSMNLYYCAAPVRVCVNREHLDKVFGTLDKTHSSINFILRENWRSTMYIVIKENEYSGEDSYDIDVEYKPEEQRTETEPDNDTNYPLRFTLTSKYFKTKINTIRKHSNSLTIQKVGNSPLQLTSTAKSRINWTGALPDADKIQFKSTLSPDDIFTVSICIDYIKPLSSSNVGDNIQIAADKSRRMSFTTYLDKVENGHAACIKVFTEIDRLAPATI